MLINDNIKSLIHNKDNNYGSKLFKLPMKKINIQSRNISTIFLKNENTIKKQSFSSTKETTPRKDPSQILQQKTQNKKCDESDDSLSQISQILNSSNKDRNFSGLIGKFPGIYDEPSILINDHIKYNKSRINKTKNLINKIGKIKLSIISSKESINQTSDREQKCFSDRTQIGGIQKNKKGDDRADVSCCFFC